MKNLILFSILFFSTLIYTSCDISDEKYASIYGQVLAENDHDTTCIPNAIILLNGPSYVEKRTDNMGRFDFEYLALGEYEMTIIANRYHPLIMDITVVDGQYDYMDITMDYISHLSTNVLNFGTDETEIEIEVTNVLDIPIRLLPFSLSEMDWLEIDIPDTILEPSEISTLKFTLDRSSFTPEEDEYEFELQMHILDDTQMNIIETYDLKILFYKL